MSFYKKRFYDFVDEVSEFEVKKNSIEKISFLYRGKKYIITSLKENNLISLYNYFNEFIDVEKKLFGFPLFTPINKSLNQFKEDYLKWLSEKNSWNLFMLIPYETSTVIACSYIKKIGFKNKLNSENKSPTWMNSVHKNFRAIGMTHSGFSMIMGLVVHIQAELKKVNTIYTRARENNRSIAYYHKKLGYSLTGKKYLVQSNGQEYYDLEYHLDIN